MKLTLSWLKQHFDTTASLEEICDKLTALGLEVEGVEDPGKALAPFIVAHVVTAEKHPNADKLKVCTVDTGKGTIQVVCGAPNARTGIKAVLALPGVVIPETAEALKPGTIRGVESQGMLCAADELNLGGDHSGIIELPDNAPVGVSFAIYGGYNDPVIEMKLTPNRPDCGGVRGLARDLVAAGLGTLKPLDVTAVKGIFKSPIAVKLDFPADAQNACPHFVARVIRNVKNGPSPQWLQERLRAIGQRPISALVDITNYLTFDLARPLHVFDAAKVQGDLAVRFAREGETLAALNGKSYDLKPGMTVIADASGPLSLGGIIGGESSGCEESTTDIVLEAAYFDPARTACTGRELQIITDARWRFERGIDPASTETGAEIATRMILELCSTENTEVSELVITGHAPIANKTVTLRLDRCKTLIGIDVPVTEQKRILNALGFELTDNNGALTAKVPSWRPDIDGEADLVEEILRVHGFEAIPPTPMERTTPLTQSALTLAQRRAGLARRALAAQGLLEAVTWSFMPSPIAAHFGQVDPALKLVNPISSDLDVMRPSILGNLIMAAKRNADRGFPNIGLFEVGPAFRDATPEGQILVAAGLRAGTTLRNWAQPMRTVDAFDAKADILAALAACGAPTGSLQITADAPDWYHPGRSGCLRLGPNVLASFGEIHPAVIEACGAEGRMAGFEIFLANIPQPKSSAPARPLLQMSPLQPVSRDFAFVVDQGVTSDRVIKAIRQADKTLIADVQVFDVYVGKNLGEGKKSLAIGVTLQPTTTTLTDAQLEEVSTKIVASVAKTTGGTLRT